jgi:outer membrane protein assembly factor BamB
MRKLVGTLLVMCFCARVFGAVGSVDLMRDWPGWRGPLGNGVGPLARPPVVWSESKNVRWKVALAGKGHSSPIVVGDRIFLTAARPVGPEVAPVYDQAPGTHDNLPVTRKHQFLVVALSRKDGSTLWEKVVGEEFPHEGGHETGSLANNSAVSDRELVYVNFGSRGVFCFDFDGALKWKKNLGRMDTLHAHGEGSSPVVHGEKLIVCWDHEGDSFLYAFDKRTGRELWKTARAEKTSWATPLIVESEGRFQVVTSATKRIRGYDVESGELIWECAGLSRNVICTPVALKGMVIACNSYDFAAMLAIRLAGAKGDITGTTNVVWKLNRMTPYVSSPLLYDETLYFLRHNQNVMSRMNPVTGEFKGEPIRLDGIRDFIFASPVGAAGRIYFAARDGVTVVLSHDAANNQLAVNKLDDAFSASPALAGNDLFLRGEKFLYCLAEGKL